MHGAKLIGPGGLITDYSDLSLHFEATGGDEFPFGASVIDTFTGTNATNLSVYDAAWVDDANHPLEIQSNACAGEDQDFDNFGYRTETYGPDVAVALTVSTLPSQNGDAIMLFARLDSGITQFNEIVGYALWITYSSTGDESWRFYHCDEGFTALGGAAFTQAVAAGDSIGFTLTGGNTLQAYHKPAAGSWAAVSSPVVDASPHSTAAGRVGINTWSSSVRLDDLIAGTI